MPLQGFNFFAAVEFTDSTSTRSPRVDSSAAERFLRLKSGISSSSLCWAELINAKVERKKLQYHRSFASQYPSFVVGQENTPITAAALKVLYKSQFSLHLNCFKHLDVQPASQNALLQFFLF